MRNKKAVLSKSARQGSVPPWPSNTGWRLQLCPCPCPLLAGGEGAACSSDSIRASKMDGFSGGIPPYSFLTVPWIHSNYLISSGLYTWVQVELLLLTTGLLLLSSSQIFLKASSSWEVGRQRGFPCQEDSHSSSAAHATSSRDWGWQSHLGNIACAPVSRKHLALPDSWAEGLGFPSAEQHHCCFLSCSGLSWTYLSWAARVTWCVTLGCLCASPVPLRLGCCRWAHLLGRSPSIMPSWKSSSPCCFFLAVMSVKWFFVKTFVIFHNKEQIVTCWQDIGAAI